MRAPTTTPVPGATAPMAPRVSTGPWVAMCASRFQFASLSTCQMPLRFGFPALVRGTAFCAIAEPAAASRITVKSTRILRAPMILDLTADGPAQEGDHAFCGFAGIEYLVTVSRTIDDQCL